MTDIEIVKRELSKQIQRADKNPDQFSPLYLTAWAQAATALWSLRQMGEA